MRAKQPDGQIGRRAGKGALAPCPPSSITLMMVGTLPPSLVELRRTSRFTHPTDCELICFARKHNLGAKLRQINTTGKSVKTCPAPPAKIFCLTRRPNQSHNSARLTADEGRWPSSRTRGEMRWTLLARETYAPEAYGEVVWFGRRGAGAKSWRSEASRGRRRQKSRSPESTK